MVNLLTSIWNFNYVKNTDDFHYEGKRSRATSKSGFFAVNRDEWDTKHDTGKSMKKALYVLWFAKRHLSAEVTSNSEKIKPIALAVFKLCFSEGINQSVTQSVENSINNLFSIPEQFVGNILGRSECLFKLNQYCLIVIREK